MIRASEFKNIRLFPIIHNRDAFLVKEHPELHPETSEYVKYWKEQKIRCIEGFWGNDTKESNVNNWRYASGPLYWYANMWSIKFQDPFQKSEYYSRPLLRDNEWIVFNAILAAQGFSGFELDEEVTCHRIVKKYYDSIEGKRTKSGELITLNKLEQREIEASENIRKPNGEYKEYVEAYEYLKRTFPKPLGKPLYENSVKNLLLLSARALGKSFIISAIAGHEFTFDGLKYYLPSSKVKTQSGVFIGAADGDKSTDLITKIKEGLEALPGSFGEGADFVPSPFFKQIKGSWNEGESVEHSYKVQEGGQWKTKGSKSKIFHGNFGHDTHDAVGKRCTKIFVEELGELDKIETIHSANERVLKVGNNKFGMEFGIGTGGNVKYINGAKKLFYNPSQYDYYEFEDVHENSGNIGLFLPATYAYNELKDDNGNTDLESALEMCVQIRNEKSTADTSMPLDMEMMYAPLKPSEVFLNPNQNKFPVALLRSRQVHLELNGLFKAKAQFGTLEYTRDNSIRWMPDMTLKPITTYRVDERADLRGSVVIYEHPGDLIKPLYNRSLYKIAYDVVGSEGGGSSLASIIVYKGMPNSIQDPSEMRNTIVAEYIGRLNNVDNIHEIVIRLAKYYRARILYEDNVPGFLTYCRQNGHLDLLQPTPTIALGEIYKGDFKKNKFGIRMTSQLIDAADNKTRAWFLQEIDKDENGVVTKFNVDSIYSPRFLDEYINYDGIGNFDHISCFRIIQLWLADEIAVPITATEDFKKENVIIERALRHREDGVKKFLKY